MGTSPVLSTGVFTHNLQGIGYVKSCFDISFLLRRPERQILHIVGFFFLFFLFFLNDLILFQYGPKRVSSTIGRS